MTGKMLAAAAGAAAGYAVYRRQQDPTQGTAGDFVETLYTGDLIASTPLVNVAAGALAAVASRSAVAGFITAFALSAFAGTRLEQIVAQKVHQARQGNPQTSYPEAA